MEAAIVDYLDKIIDPFLNPQKRGLRGLFDRGCLGRGWSFVYFER